MDCPKVHVRWWHSSHGVQHLELLATPSTKVSSLSWTKLTREESDNCEREWQALSDDEKQASMRSEPDQPVAAAVYEDGEEDLLLGVPIGKEKLFEVDVRTMSMYPVFWKLSGSPILVRRFLWMYDENRSVEEALSEQLEKAYQDIKPWEPSYQEELAVALQVGPAAYEKLKHNIPDSDVSIFFDDADSARLVHNSFANRFSTAFFSSIRGGKSGSPYSSSSIVYRGYDEAVKRSKAPSRPVSNDHSRAATPAQSDVETHERRKSLGSKVAEKFESEMDADLGQGYKSEPEGPKKRRAKTPDAKAKVGEGNLDDVTDLILVVHGIGYGLSTQYEHYNFLYMVNLMRIVARKQAMSPALSSIMRSGNVQFLPVQWRNDFKPDLDDEETKQREEDGLDNRFKLADITLQKHIPMVRELTNEVLIDIPYFMSNHRTNMIELVCKEANRTYRLWCARNPEFSKTGRVHIVAHSLGSALCAHILSSQPTIQPPLEDLHAKVAWNQFLFNVDALFMIGSPLAVFLHINQAQLIARKGRERTKDSPPDEALDKAGVFGCMAVDSLYNIFQLSDPIAYKLNACVDSKRAARLPPIAIPSITGTLLGNFQKGVSKMFDGLFSTSGTDNTNESEELIFELGGGPKKLQGSRAERRFAALNPHGALDFFLPGEGNISEYVDMITAHSSYWGDPSFAAFILAEIFARKEDLARTGLGAANIDATLGLNS